MKNKKIITAILVLFTMVISLMPMTAMAAVTVTDDYYNVPFTGGVINNTSADGPTVAHRDWTGVATISYPTDAITGSEVLKVAIPSTASSLYRFGTESVSTVSGLKSKVIWYELSFKFDDYVLPTQLTSTGTIFNILKDGSLVMGTTTSDTTAVIPNVKIEADKWYKLVVAVDAVDTLTVGANVFARFYAWLNGEMLATDRPSSIGGANWYMTKLAHTDNYVDSFAQLRLHVTANTDGDGSISMDDFKIYTSSVGVNNSGFDPTAIFADCGLTVSNGNMVLIGDKLFVNDGTKISEIASAVSSEGNISFSNADTEAVAVGEKIYVASSAGGIKTYSIKKKEAFMLAENYFDLDYNTGAAVNAASALAFERVAGTVSQSYANDAVKGNSHTSFTGSGMVLGKQSINAENLDQRTIWYELSLKMNGAVARTDLRSGKPVFEIGEDGTFYIGSMRNVPAYGQPITTDKKLVADKWYNIKIAVDWLDTYVSDDEEIYPKFYCWLNGELLKTSDSIDYTMHWYNGGDLRKQMTNLMMYTESTNLSIDDLKVYTTYTPVRDADGKLAVREGFLNDFVNVDEDTMNRLDDTLYVTDENITYANIATATGAKVLSGDGTDISESTEKALGNTVYLRSENGVVLLNVLVKEASYTVDAVDLTNAAAPKITVTNTTPGAKNASFVIAAYKTENGVKKLVDTTSKSGKVAWETNEITLNEIDLTGATTYRLFVWDSLAKLVPVFNFEAQAIN